MAFATSQFKYFNFVVGFNESSRENKTDSFIHEHLFYKS